MKIAFLIPSQSGGGAEFVAQEWAKWLATRGHESSLLLTHPKQKDGAPLGVSVIKVGGSSFGSRARALRAQLKAGGYDAVVSLMPYWNVLLLISALGPKRGMPKLFISGRNVEMPLRAVFGITFRLTQFAARLTYWRADGYIAISHPVAAEASALYKVAGAKISVIPNPASAKLIGLPRISLDSSDDESQTAIHLVVPARIVKQKRPMIAVDVAEILARRGFDCRVHYFGEGDQRERVQRAAESKNVSVEFHGWVDSWFTDCPPGAVVLLASLSEGFGNVLIEAAGAGFQSVVSSRCLGSADAIVPGMTGELVRGDSAEEYAQGVLAAHARGGVSGVEQWLARFDPVNSGELLLSAIEEAFQ